MSFKKLVLGALMAGAAACGLASAASAAGEYDGVTVNILTRPGPVIAGRVALHQRLDVIPCSRHSSRLCQL